MVAFALLLQVGSNMTMVTYHFFCQLLLAYQRFIILLKFASRVDCTATQKPKLPLYIGLVGPSQQDICIWAPILFLTLPDTT